MNKNTFHHLVATFINVLYFGIVFLTALTISSLALTRRLNSYEASQTPLLLHIEKDEIEITNPLPGRIEKVLVSSGQHVKKGDLLIQLSDEVSRAKIESLEKVAKENVSARTEVTALKAQNDQYKIYAPRDGIVYKTHIVEGAYLVQNSLTLTMFSDSNVKLVASVSPAQYLELQKQKNLDIYSSRREQIFSVQLDGVSRVINTENKPSQYELNFHFINPDDASSFIQGENLNVLSRSHGEEALKPAALVAQFWNSLISGK